MKYYKNKYYVYLLIFILLLLLLLCFFYNSQSFKRSSIEKKIGLTIPTSSTVVEFQHNDSLFAKLEMTKSDYIVFEGEILRSTQLITEDRWSISENLENYCSWWDIKSDSAEKIYSMASSSNPGTFGIRKIWILILPEESNCVTVYIATIG